MELLEPKFKRLGKPGHIWPGVYKIPKSYQDQKNPWHLACPAPLCFYRGSYPDEGMARRLQETHPCPWFGGGKTTISRGMMSDMFLAPIWKKLDEAVDELMEYLNHDLSSLRHPGVANDSGVISRQERARGLADALSVLMPPFFSTGDEIVREAMVRYQKRKAGEEYETPGIGRLRFAVPPGAEKMTPSGMYHDSVVGTKHAPEYHPAHAVKNFGLSEEKVAEILKQHSQGFQPKMLAVVHEVTVDVIVMIIKANG